MQIWPIPLPCDFGEMLITNDGLRMLVGVSWFTWTDRVTFSYFFSAKDKWSAGSFIDEDNPTYKLQYQIDNTLLLDGFLKDKGYPIKGRGYLSGLSYKNNQIYAELILTDQYFAHIYVQCNNNGAYVPGGDVIVPPSWDTEEKRNSIILKQYAGINVSCLVL